MSSFIFSVKARLIAGFALLFVFLSAIGGFSYHGLTTLDRHAHDIYVSNTQPILDVAAVRAATLRIRLMLWRAQVEKNKDATARASADIARSRESLQKAWTHYYPDGISSARERELAARIEGSLGAFAKATDQVLAFLREENYDAAMQYQGSQLAPMADALSASIDDNLNDNATQASASAESGAATAQRIILISVCLVAAGGLLALVVSTMLVRNVSSSLTNAIDVATRVAEGKLGAPIDATARDEFGQLLGTLKRMDDTLATTVRSIRDTSESVMVASSQIASGNIDLSARTEEQAASLEQTASSMSQITETVKQNADNARQANSLARSASDLSNANNHAVDAMVRTMASITASSGKIADITSIIEGIAFQTNILALNAAVEAARAGEQGRGFAVVAGEVRSLAQRSSSAAKEIKDLIGESSGVVQEGSRQAAEVGSAMQEVTRVINTVSDIVSEIAAASDEQSRGVEQVHVAISQIDAVTQQNAALVEEATAAAQSLEEQATRMKREVTFFQLDGDPAPVSAYRPAAPAAAVGARESL